MESNLDKRYQTLVILWFALLMAIVMYFIFSLVAAPAISHEPGSAPNPLPIVALTVLGAFLVIVSFLVKRKLLERSVEQQDTGLVQKGLVIACAMCEVSAMLGLLEHFMFGNRGYYWLFLLAGGGIALHFPRRSHLEAASYKSRSTLT